MTDCLIIGFNDSNFEEYVQLVRSMGVESGAYRDLNLAFIEYEGKPYRSMDILNRFHFENNGGSHHRFSNVDFLWPVVLYLGSYLHQRGFSFDYVNLFHEEKEKLKEKLATDDVLLVAITTTLYVTAHPILEIISFIRQHNDKVKIVVGGPYIHNQTRMVDGVTLQQQLKYMDADFYVISQEGEAALVNLLRALKEGRSFDDTVDNLAYRQADKYVLTKSSIESNPLEENPIDYSLFPQKEINQFISLRTAKSCPFSCAFCGFPQRAGKYKYTGVELVERELNTLADLGVDTITFLDDTFNVPKQRFRDILQMMITNNYGFKWNSFYRSDHGDEATVDLMRRAGCEGVFLGVESGSDEMLNRMNKTSRRKNYLAAIKQLQSAGISAHANVIVGFPGETYETVQETVSLIEETRPDFFRAQLWYADPMTPIWQRREEYGVKGSSFHWSHDTMDYQTACDLIDRMFLSIENSTWLPQNGFEQWSTFYLQRKGMTLDRIKTFLKCFNAAVKSKIINGHNKEIDPRLLESLKTSCRFKEPASPDMEVVEVVSGARYRAAEEYWLKDFDGAKASGLDLLRSKNEEREAEMAVFPCTVNSQLLMRLQDKSGADLAQVGLALYSAFLSRLSGREETLIVAALDDCGTEQALPLRLHVPWTLSFADFIEQVGAKMDQAAEHSLYGLSILTNPLRMEQHGAVSIKFDTGYYYHGENGNGSNEVLRLFPEVKRSVDLALIVNHRGPQIEFAYQKGCFSFETIERLAAYFTSLVEEIDRNPQTALGEIALGGERHVSVTQLDEVAEFHF